MKLRNLGLVALSFLFVGSVASCAGDPVASTDPATSEKQDELKGVLSYRQFMDAEVGSEVTIAGYVQGRQSWYKNECTIYLQDDDGGYFGYKLKCTKEQYDNDLKIGNRIKLTGVKGEWEGMVEVMCSEAGAEGTFEVLEGTKIYDYKVLNDVTPENLLAHLSQKVRINNLTVVTAPELQEGNNDLAYKVTDGERIFDFYVEEYLTAPTSELYKTVQTLKPGDVIDAAGFMYAYGGAQLHTTVCEKHNKNVLTKSEGVKTHAEYLATPKGEEVTVEGFVQAKQGWWENKCRVYLADQDGAYFLYDLPCTKDQYNKELKIGNKIKVTGIKAEWEGMVEVKCSEAGAEGSFEALEGRYCAPIKDLTELLPTPDIFKHCTEKVRFTNLEVVSVTAPTQDGGDIYYVVKQGEKTFTFCVESYLTGSNTQVYKDVLALKAGDKITTEGFLYIYGDSEKGIEAGPQLHTTSVIKVIEK